jgi:hypothetical protein
MVSKWACNRKSFFEGWLCSYPKIFILAASTKFGFLIISGICRLACDKGGSLMLYVIAAVIWFVIGLAGWRVFSRAGFKQ